MRLLFVCTHNRCRSILAEAVFRDLHDSRLQACSAGSQPAGALHPQTLRALERHQLPTIDLHSKSWDDLGEFKPDIVITVCDSAAGEACPLWMGQALRVHWGLPDPSRLDGTQTQIDSAFDDVITTLRQRAASVSNLDLDNTPLDVLRLRLQSLVTNS